MTHHEGTETRRKDKTYVLFSLSLIALTASYLVPVLSVHTYCEIRGLSGFIALVSAGLFVMFLRNNAATAVRKAVSGLGAGVCVIAIVVGVSFIAYATMKCNRMNESLESLDKGSDRK